MTHTYTLTPCPIGELSTRLRLATQALGSSAHRKSLEQISRLAHLACSAQ